MSTEVGNEVTARRERAFEVADDGPGDQYTYLDVQEAIKVATTVVITDDVIHIANDVQEGTPGTEDAQMRAALTAALKVLGFEVEK
jgi:RNA binding exosome subunit